MYETGSQHMASKDPLAVLRHFDSIYGRERFGHAVIVWIRLPRPAGWIDRPPLLVHFYLGHVYIGHPD